MPDYNFYVIAYFDLLGQSALLEVLSDEYVVSCITSGKLDELKEKMKPTFGRVKGFRDHLRQMVHNINQPIPLPQELEGKVAASFWRQLTNAKITVEFMGDAAILKVHISNHPAEPNPIVSIKDLLTGISMQMLAFLGAGIAVRGAIEFGWGAHIEENSIYGTMLSRAHRLEKEAGYPRVVVGQNFFNYLHPLATYLQQGVSEEESTVIMKAAREALSLVIEDNDGELILNYLRRELYSVHETAFIESVQSSKKFILSEIARLRQSRERKLMNSYCMLKRFFQTNAAW